jgi:hypothetical protein
MVIDHGMPCATAEVLPEAIPGRRCKAAEVESRWATIFFTENDNDRIAAAGVHAVRARRNPCRSIVDIAAVQQQPVSSIYSRPWPIPATHKNTTGI